jgi:low affinity Fe/Cu permease
VGTNRRWCDAPLRINIGGVMKASIAKQRDQAQRIANAPVVQRTQHSWLSRVAFRSASWTGSMYAAMAVTAFTAVWVAVGFGTNFPRWWELVMTIGAPVLSLLMLIVVQHTQSHAVLASQVKLDELIRASFAASDAMIAVEEASKADLGRLHADFVDRAQTD